MDFKSVLEDAYEMCQECLESNDCVGKECRWTWIMRALIKQVAAKPNTDEYNNLICSNCGEPISYDHNHCPNCGKAIDWSDCEGEDCNKCFSPCDTCDYKLTCKVENCNCRICHHYGYCDHCEMEELEMPLKPLLTSPPLTADNDKIEDFIYNICDYCKMYPCSGALTERCGQEREDYINRRNRMRAFREDILEGIKETNGDFDLVAEAVMNELNCAKKEYERLQEESKKDKLREADELAAAYSNFLRKWYDVDGEYITGEELIETMDFIKNAKGEIVDAMTDIVNTIFPDKELSLKKDLGSFDAYIKDFCEKKGW